MSSSYKIDMPTPSSMARANSFSSSTQIMHNGMSTWRKAVLILFVVVFCALSIFTIKTLYYDGTEAVKFGPIGRQRVKTYPEEDLDDDNLSQKFTSVKYNFQNPKTQYEVVLVADRDTQSFNSKEKIWHSMLMHGRLKRLPKPDEHGNIYSLSFVGEPQELKSKLVEGDRGMELSELKQWRGNLYTVDDRTGIVYEITEDAKVIARYILMDGNGATQKGFKGEWMTVKDNKLYVGSIGKEWTTKKGEIINYNPMFVKVIDSKGRIEHLNWKHVYDGLRDKLSVPYPGYIVHEAMEWSDVHHKWFILPRRVSKETYDDEIDISKGSNIIIIANEDFSDIQVKTVGKITPTRGFSTFKFIPDRPNEIIAVKSEETMDGKMQSYITVFTLTGEILLDETKIADDKLEGIEIK